MSNAKSISIKTKENERCNKCGGLMRCYMDDFKTCVMCGNYNVPLSDRFVIKEKYKNKL